MVLPAAGAGRIARAGVLDIGAGGVVVAIGIVLFVLAVVALIELVFRVVFATSTW